MSFTCRRCISSILSSYIRGHVGDVGNRSTCCGSNRTITTTSSSSTTRSRNVLNVGCCTNAIGSSSRLKSTLTSSSSSSVPSHVLKKSRHVFSSTHSRSFSSVSEAVQEDHVNGMSHLIAINFYNFYSKLHFTNSILSFNLDHINHHEDILQSIFNKPISQVTVRDYNAYINSSPTSQSIPFITLQLIQSFLSRQDLSNAIRVYQSAKRNNVLFDNTTSSGNHNEFHSTYFNLAKQCLRRSIYRYRKQGKSSSDTTHSQQIIQDLIQPPSSFRLDGRDLTNLISDFGLLGQFDFISNVLQTLSQQYSTSIVNNIHYNAFLAARIRHAKVKTVKDTLAVMNRVFTTTTRPDSTSYVVCMNTLIQNGHYNSAVNLFIHGVKKGIRTDTVAINVLLNALTKSGQHQVATAVFEIVFSNNANHETKEIPSFPELFAILPGQQSLKPNESTFNTLIGFHPRLLSQMETFGIPPTSTTFNVYIDGCLNRQDIDAVLHVLERLLSSANLSEPLLVDQIMFNTIVNGLGRLGRFDALDSVYKSITKAGILPNRFVYNSLMKSYLMHGRFEQVLKTYQLASLSLSSHNEFKSNTNTNTNMNVNELGLNISLPLQAALSLGYNSIVDRLLAQSNIGGYITAFQYYKDMGDIVNCESVFWRMLNSGYRPFVSQVSELFKLWMKSGQWEKMIQYWELVTMDKSEYELMVEDDGKRVIATNVNGGALVLDGGVVCVLLDLVSRMVVNELGQLAPKSSSSSPAPPTPPNNAPQPHNISKPELTHYAIQNIWERSLHLSQHSREYHETILQNTNVWNSYIEFLLRVGRINDAIGIVSVMTSGDNEVSKWDVFMLRSGVLSSDNGNSVQGRVPLPDQKTLMTVIGLLGYRYQQWSCVAKVLQECLEVADNIPEHSWLREVVEMAVEETKCGNALIKFL